MSERKEREPGFFYSSLFLILCFVLIYSPFHFGGRELYWREGDYAAMAQEMDLLFPSTVAHGEIFLQSFPLYPWCAAFFNRFLGVDMAFSLRLISVLSLAAITFLVWLAGKRSTGRQAAVVAAAAMISSNLVIEKTLDGYPDFTGLLFIFCAWLLWFTYGVARSNWNKAWIFSAFFCGLGFYTIGWSALFYFFFPLIFMRRPMTVWSKLRRPGFFVGVGVIIFFILVWGVPRWSLGQDIPFRSLPDRSEFEGYFSRLYEFPLDVLVRFLPWTIIAWCPFCVAFYPLDKNPIFSRFLRTIFISLFVFLWLSPLAKVRDMIILAPPLSLMIGINYWLLARRYGHKYHQMLKIFSFAAIIAGATLACFYLVPTEWWQDFVSLSRGISYRDEWTFRLLGFIYAAALVMIGIFLIFAVRLKVKLWEHILIIVLAFMLFFWGAMYPYKAQEHSKRDFGIALRNAIGDDFSPEMTIYKAKRTGGLYGECFYLGCNIRKIHSFEELPGDDKRVYLISTEVPIFPDRLWTNLLPEHMKYKDKKIYLWRGEKLEKKTERY